jgi:hypothetical protein
VARTIPPQCAQPLKVYSFRCGCRKGEDELGCASRRGLKRHTRETTPHLPPWDVKQVSPTCAIPSRSSAERSSNPRVLGRWKTCSRGGSERMCRGNPDTVNEPVRLRAFIRGPDSMQVRTWRARPGKDILEEYIGKSRVGAPHGRTRSPIAQPTPRAVLSHPGIATLSVEGHSSCRPHPGTSTGALASP